MPVLVANLLSPSSNPVKSLDQLATFNTAGCVIASHILHQFRRLGGSIDIVIMAASLTGWGKIKSEWVQAGGNSQAIRLLTAATIRPAHARPPHPTWVTAVRRSSVLSPSGQTVVSASCFPQYVTVLVPEGIRDVDVLGFSAGSYSRLAIHEVLNEFDCFPPLR